MTFEDQLPEPSVAFVVHEVVNLRGDSPSVWAWCKLQPDGQPGYSEVTYTLDDGATKVDKPSGARLGPVIVKVWC